jgi:tight adherence protein B
MITVISLLAAAGTFFLFDGLTGRRRTPPLISSRITTLLAEAGMHGTSASRFVMICLGSWVGALFVVAGVTGSMIVALALSSLAAWSPYAYARSRRRKRQELLRDAWPDAITSLISSVRAGIALAEACSHLAEAGPDHLRPGFEAFRRSYRAHGSFQIAIRELRRILADPIADRVAAAILIAHDVGGNDLVRTLRALGDFTRDDVRIRREIHARWSWTVTAARVAAAAPWLVLLMMATRPEAARAYNSAAGAVVVLGGAAATFLGYRLMLRAARLPDHRRLS